MFVDELTITAKAGDGGDGVVRWRREKFVPLGGPAGGNGGNGGDVYIRAVRDLGLLSKYTGSNEFSAGNGSPGEKRSRYGKNGEDMYIDVPVGAVVTDTHRNHTYTLFNEHEVHKILKGGRGGLGNEHFKSSTNRSPEESTQGRRGEKGEFYIELSLIVDAGIIGLPNAGKSTIINALTNAQARVGAYPFTTTQPGLGELYGFVLADIPGLILGASEGKGLGHTFLRHIKRTKMLLHCVSLEAEEPLISYRTIRNELKKFDESLLEKQEWVLLTKTDLVTSEQCERVRSVFEKEGVKNIFEVSGETNDGVKELSDALVRHLRATSVTKIDEKSPLP